MTVGNFSILAVLGDAISEKMLRTIICGESADLRQPIIPL